jgi:hypothetical protein
VNIWPANLCKNGRRFVYFYIAKHMFDTVFWSYCEMSIGKTGHFGEHCSAKFGYLK